MSILNEEQFFANKTVDENGCWIWAGSVSSAGYGLLTWYGKTQRANRISLALATGTMPRGMYSCHKCDVPRCINPEHLYWGTHEENSADKLGRTYFDGKCRRGHDKNTWGKGKNKLCHKCQKLIYIAKKLNSGGELSSSNKIALKNLGEDWTDPNFQKMLEDYV